MGLKALRPSLREKKRYVTFEMITQTPVGLSSVATAIEDSFHDLYGTIGLASAGLLIIKEKYNSARQRGVVRVTHTSVQPLMASFAWLNSCNGAPAIVHSLSCSGMLNTAAKAIN